MTLPRLTKERLLAAIDEYEYDMFGLRIEEVIPEDGSIVRCSRVWVDGDPTDELLPGASALILGGSGDRSDRERRVRRAIKFAGSYAGKYMILLGADRWSYGVDTDDVGVGVIEVVLEDAVVLERWCRPVF